MNANKLIAAAAVVVVIGAAIFFVYNGVFPKSTFDPLNASYILENTPVSLVNGKTEREAAPDSATMIKIQVFGQPVTGDLNGDGKKDAALIIQEDSGGSGAFYYAAVAVNADSGTKGTNVVFLGDRIAPQSIVIRDGVVVINYAERKPGEPMTAQPSVGVSKYLYLDGEILKTLETSNKFAEINSPIPYAVITNPVAVSGKSNFFEANTRIRIKDADGNILADTFVTAAGWMDKTYPFSRKISFSEPKTGKGFIEVFESSAKDGSEINKIAIPILFYRTFD
ncbi:MAG: Gmad2 immunoglobulin-like domain-containing protein [Patescibacteria group bacterium]